ncbi:MAG TPA: hypothetical protein VFU72_07480 [Nitrolancea sp.]|nr:hypothetical protein [Nitrolancea sp.]
MLCSPHTRPLILLVEDDPAVRDVTVLALQEAGYRVVAVATLAEMADAPTTTAAWTSPAWLRQAAGAMQVVIFTAYAPSRFAGYAARGFAGLLAQPFDLDAFLTQVQALLQVA